MKRPILLLSLVAWAFAAHAQNTNTTSATNIVVAGNGGAATNKLAGGLVEFLPRVIDFSGVPGLKLTLDPKAIENGSFGLDFSASYERLLFGEDGVAGNKLFADIRADGYAASDRDDSQNSIIVEGRFSGNLLLGGTQKLTPAQQLRAAELLNQIDDPFADAALRQEYDRIMHNDFPRYASFDMHFKNESDQRVKDNQQAVGVGFASDLALLFGEDRTAKLLDIPFAVLRSKNVQYKPRLLRFYTGYDYVAHSDVEEREKLTTDDNFSRLTAQFAYSTLIFKNIELRFAEQIYYELEAVSAIKRADKDFTAFFEASASIAIDRKNKKRVFVKYATGDLPPTLKNSSEFSAGFSFDLGALTDSRTQ